MQTASLTQQQKAILGIGGVLILILVLGFTGIIPGLRKKPSATRQISSLTVWGVGDDKSVFDSIFPGFGVSITYVKKDYATYEQDLITALAAGEGPDVFMIHDAWLPKYQNLVTPAPADLITPLTVQKQFPDVVSQDFIRNGNIYALPLSIDTLALFYDKDIFNGSFVSAPPRTWGQLETLATRLTKRDATGAITQSGIALGGSATNVDKAADILSMLMIQNGSKMSDGASYTSALDTPLTIGGGQPGVDALKFYLQFADPHSSFFTWDTSQHYSIDAFSYNPSVNNKVAMMINYHYQIPTLLAKNPNLNFGVATLPQQDSATEAQYATYPDYWGYAVSKASKDPALAWKFVLYLTAYNQAKTYLQNTHNPPALRALIQNDQNDPILSVFANQILIAKSWVRPGHETTNSVLSNAISSVQQGLLSPDEAISAANQQLNALFNAIPNKQ
ncbi:MAG: extracellular solute-binding protein [Patescibacteria group bacterium]|nr:extracellular solute-binding protein [Patescibacteria group bacterium]MDE2438408.1 extracellular solute-binding protein [Patescibacteria group bacterium]